jgi:diketogulonate reductase-like aldo/keto reductase
MVVPIEQGRVLSHPAVRAVAERHAATPAQVALAWVIRQRRICAIPKSGSRAHVSENAAALGVGLNLADLHELDLAFPPPLKPHPLETL